MQSFARRHSTDKAIIYKKGIKQPQSRTSSSTKRQSDNKTSAAELSQKEALVTNYRKR